MRKLNKPLCPHPVLRSAAALLLRACAATAFGSPRVYPTGVTIYDPSRAYNSFLCFTGADNITHLIDMDGNEEHRWPFPGLPGEVINPQLVGGQRGHVLLQTSQLPDNPGGIFGDRTVGELDWEGRTLWEWGTQAPGGAARQNHDWARLPNGNTLLLVAIPHVVPGLGPKELADQGIYEVASDGKLLWTWIAGDHLQQFGFTPAGLEYMREKVKHLPLETWGYLEINDMQVLGPNRWFDAGDTRFNPSNIMIDPAKATSSPSSKRRPETSSGGLAPTFEAANTTRISASSARTCLAPSINSPASTMLTSLLKACPAPATCWSSTMKAEPDFHLRRSASTPGRVSSRSTPSSSTLTGNTPAKPRAAPSGVSSVHLSAAHADSPTATHLSTKAWMDDSFRSRRREKSSGSMSYLTLHEPCQAAGHLPAASPTASSPCPMTGFPQAFRTRRRRSRKLIRPPFEFPNSYKEQLRLQSVTTTR